MPDDPADDRAVALAALARRGDWQLDVDHAGAGGDERWFVQIETPLLYLYFRVAAPAVLGELAGFFRSSAGTTAPLGRRFGFSAFDGVPVTIVQDHEFADRYFISIGTGGGGLTITLAGEALVTFVAAIGDLVAELTGA